MTKQHVRPGRRGKEARQHRAKDENYKIQVWADHGDGTGYWVRVPS